MRLGRISENIKAKKRALKVGDDTVFQPGHDDLPIRQKEYRKGRGVKDSKAQKGHRNGKMKQMRGDRISEIRVHYVLQ